MRRNAVPVYIYVLSGLALAACDPLDTNPSASAATGPAGSQSAALLNSLKPQSFVETTVTTDKIAYSPGETVSFTVTATNVHNEAFDMAMWLEVACELDHTTNGLTQDYGYLATTGLIQPGATWTRTYTWQTPNEELWGCDVVADYRSRGSFTPVFRDVARTVFVVTDDVPKVAANYVVMTPLGGGEPTADFIDTYRSCASPMMEHYAWYQTGWGGDLHDAGSSWDRSACDQENWGDLEPSWNVGSAGSLSTVRGCQLAGIAEAAHERGMTALAYLDARFHGPVGCAGATGTHAGDVAKGAAGDISCSTDPTSTGWFLQANTTPTAMQARIENDYLPTIVNDLGFDGIRWDNFHAIRHALVPAIAESAADFFLDSSDQRIIYQDPDASLLALAQAMNAGYATFAAANPAANLVIGHNLAPFDDKKPGNLGLAHIGRTPRAYQACASGRVIIDEKGWDGINHQHETWGSTIDSLRYGNETLKRLGAYHYTGSMPTSLSFNATEQQREDYYLASHALVYASGARAYASCSRRHFADFMGPGSSGTDYPDEYLDFVTFAQRFSKYFFHPSLISKASIGDHGGGVYSPTVAGVKVDGQDYTLATETVVWEDFEYLLQDDGNLYHIIHFWHQPDTAGGAVDVESMPTAGMNDVNVEVAVHEPHQFFDARKVEAFALSPEYGWNGTDHWSRSVAWDADKLELPAFNHWAVLVIKYPIYP